MAEEKKLKFSFELDNTSFSQVKAKIQELTTALKELANVAKSINLNAGGITAGGNMGGLLGGVSTQKQQPGLPTTAAQATARPTNVAGVLTQGLVADKNLFRTVAEGSKEALRAMKDALRQTVDEQSRDIKRLKKEIDELGASYNKIKGHSPEIAQGDMASMMAKGKELQNLQRVHSQNQNALNGGQDNGLVSRASQFLGVPRGLGVAGLALGGIAGSAMLLNAGANMYYGAGASQMQEQLYSPFAQQRIASGVGGVTGNMALSMRQGNIAMVNSTARVLGNDQFMSGIFGSNNDNARRALAAIKAGDKNTIEDWSRQGQEILGTELYGRIRGENSGEINTEIVRRHLMNQIPQEKAQEFRDAVDRDMQINVERTARFNNFYSNAQGNINTQRAFGVSSVRKGGGWQDAAARMEAMSANMGLDLGQAGGAVDAAKFSVGYRNRFKGLSFLSKQFGGFSNAAAVFGAGQEFGSGDSLLQTFAGRGGIAGRGGLDPLASSRIADIVTSQMYGSRFGSVSGVGLGETMGAVAGLSGTVGGQLRAAREFSGGINNLSQGLAGATDPLQQAINAYAGSKVFNGQFYKMNAATQMSGGDLLESLRTGKVQGQMARMFNMDDIRSYAAERDKFSLARYQIGQGGGQDEVVAGARAAGGPLAFIKSQLRGLSGSDFKGRFTELTEQLGLAEALSTGGNPIEFTRGLQLQAGADPDLLRKMKAAGVGDPTSKADIARQARDQQGKEALDTAKKLEADQPALRESIRNTITMSDKVRDLGTSLMAGEEVLTRSLVGLARFIDTKILHIKNPDSYYTNTSVLTPPKVEPRGNSASQKQDMSARMPAGQKM